MTARKQTDLNTFLSKRSRVEKSQSSQRGEKTTATGSREVGTSHTSDTTDQTLAAVLTEGDGHQPSTIVERFEIV